MSAEFPMYLQSCFLVCPLQGLSFLSKSTFQEELEKGKGGKATTLDLLL